MGQEGNSKQSFLGKQLSNSWDKYKKVADTIIKFIYIRQHNM